MILTDLHNHTTYSYDGQNSCTEIIKNAIANDIKVVGISDHQFSVRSKIGDYIRELKELKLLYKNKIDVKCGIEIGTRPAPDDLLFSKLNQFDFCIFESLDDKRAMDLYEFEQWISMIKIPKGLAHTDIFSLEERYGVDMIEFMKKNNLFWEINTSGNYPYYYDFITNPKKQQRISNSKITLSVGSDTHWIKNYNLSKLKSVHSLICQLENPIIFT